MTKQPSAATLTEAGAESLSELRYSLMPEWASGSVIGQEYLEVRLAGRCGIGERLGGRSSHEQRLAGMARAA